MRRIVEQRKIYSRNCAASLRCGGKEPFSIRQHNLPSKMQLTVLHSLLVLMYLSNSTTELDKTRGTGKKPGLGGSLFSGSVTSGPPELERLASLQSSLTKAELSARPATKNANEEYTNYSDPSRTKPSPPVQAAQLSTIMKCLARAEGAVTESIKARSTLIEELQRLLDHSKRTLKEEEESRDQVKSRFAEIETKKKDVEDAIMRGLSEEGHAEEQNQSHQSPHKEPDPVVSEPERPVVEELTPPPPETVDYTPGILDVQVDSQRENEQVSTKNIESRHDHANGEENNSSDVPSASQPGAPLVADLLSSLTNPRTIPQSVDETINGPTNAAGGPAKRRKLLNGGVDDFSGFASGDCMDEIDDDVAAMLTKD